MKAPDKIFLHGYDFDDEPCKTWDKEPRVKGLRGYPAKHAEYIRKDLLLEWAKELTSEPYDRTTESARKHQIAHYLLEKYNSL